jgi:hypothetical protein
VAPGFNEEILFYGNFMKGGPAKSLIQIKNGRMSGGHGSKETLAPPDR